MCVLLFACDCSLFSILLKKTWLPSKLRADFSMLCVFQTDNGQQLSGGESLVRKQEQRSPLLSISEVTNTLLDHWAPPRRHVFYKIVLHRYQILCPCLEAK